MMKDASCLEGPALEAVVKSALRQDLQRAGKVEEDASKRRAGLAAATLQGDRMAASALSMGLSLPPD